AGGVLLLVDPDVPHRSVRLAVQLLAGCAAGRDRGAGPEEIARDLPPALGGATRPVQPRRAAPVDALSSLRAAVELLAEAGVA
ncbi:hypothetical protein, partial [Klenkia sp. PcliD-1-E]|uniref:hypothetical protein n=1 Tax=Klenkia sp. PcliD-1-E TaxID=2954492 RepID=UPI002097CC87